MKVGPDVAFEIAKFSLVQDEPFRLSDDRRYFAALCCKSTR